MMTMKYIMGCSRSRSNNSNNSNSNNSNNNNNNSIMEEGII